VDELEETELGMKPLEFGGDVEAISGKRWSDGETRVVVFSHLSLM